LFEVNGRPGDDVGASAHPNLPAIRQQQGLTTPLAAPVRLDAIGLLSTADVRECKATC